MKYFGFLNLQILSLQFSHFSASLDPSQNCSGCLSSVISQRSISTMLVKNKLQVKKLRMNSIGVNIIK